VKILHVIPSISSADGGPSTALRAIVSASARAGLAVEVATTDDDGPAARLSVPLGERVSGDDGLAVYYFRRQTYPYKVSLPLMRWLGRHVSRYDIVHIHALFSFASTVGALCAMSRNVPYIVRPLGVLRRYGMTRHRPYAKRISFQVNEKRILERADAVHFTSPEEAIEAESLGVDIRSIVIPLGVPRFSRGSRNRFERTWPQVQGRVVLLYLGRLHPVKNLESLLRAMPRILERAPAAIALIAGEGDPAYAEGLHRLAETIGVREQVLWTGHLSEAQKDDALATADVFVLPSFSESFGIAAAEALAAGVPCVVGRDVALASDIAHAGAGVAVDPDAESIARGITSLATNVTMRRECGRNAATLAAEKYSEDGMAAGLVGLYEEILVRRRTPMSGMQTDRA
jgi:glycosyltransferase involved in cell wall biosynthesis